MKLAVSAIPEEGLPVPFKATDAAWEGLRDLDCVTLPHGELFLERIGTNVVVRGHVTALLRFSCSRCLEGFPLPMEISIRHTLRPREPAGVEPAERELEAEDLEYGFYEEGTLALDRLVEEQVLLAVPMKPLCDEACKGLCTTCGGNRNTGPCACPEPGGGFPFDILKQFVQD